MVDMIKTLEVKISNFEKTTENAKGTITTLMKQIEIVSYSRLRDLVKKLKVSLTPDSETW